MILRYTVPKENKYKTIREIALDYFRISKKYFSFLKLRKAFNLNGQVTYVDKCVAEQDQVSISVETDEICYDTPEEMQLHILYEDDAVLIVNKPPYMLVHTNLGHPHGTLANGIIAYYNSKGVTCKVRVINRLDRNTSGVCLVAKNRYIQERISQEIRCGAFVKEYRGVVDGVLEKSSATISLPIARIPNDYMRREVATHGKPSITEYHVVSQKDGYSDVQFLLHTGRTHQIRLHMQSIGHPLAGDSLYGTSNLQMPRQALYCSLIRFKHPLTGKLLQVRCDCPEDIAQFFNGLQS